MIYDVQQKLCALAAMCAGSNMRQQPCAPAAVCIWSRDSTSGSDRELPMRTIPATPLLSLHFPIGSIRPCGAAGGPPSASSSKLQLS